MLISLTQLHGQQSPESHSVATQLSATQPSWILQPARPPESLAEFFRPPPEYADDFGSFRSPLVFDDGTVVEHADQWPDRRNEILRSWHEIMGPWPAINPSPEAEMVATQRRDKITQIQMRLRIGIDGDWVTGFLQIPDGPGPFPAVVVPYYEAQSGAGLGVPLRDFGWQLAQRGFVALSIGKPNSGVNFEDYREAGRRGRYYGSPGKPVRVQPLSALAYAAAGAHAYLAARDDVHADRIGIVGHSFGGKWALFASCLYDRFACAVWSDPGIVFDERDRRKENPGGSVNYWDQWYLGFPLGQINDPGRSEKFRKLPSEGEPRTGSYKILRETNRDLTELHALMAPRPVLVSGGTADMVERWAALNHLIAVNRLLGFEHRVAMTNRTSHAPTTVSNEQIYTFMRWWLQDRPLNANGKDE